MSLFDRFKKPEAKQLPSRRGVKFLDSKQYEEYILGGGYTSLDKCPEVVTACSRIAELISSMTIYLMANTAHGDKRIVNELSKKVDIYPYHNMTRRTWMNAIVMNLLLYGRGNSVVLPHTVDGYLTDLEPIENDRIRFWELGHSDYEIEIDGKRHKSSEVLHFVYGTDPHHLWKGQGFTASIKDVADNLKQAGATEKAFMQSKWKPSVVVKVDALIDEFSSPEGRKRLVDEYLSTTRLGEPWLIPSEGFAVEQIRPLSLADLAIADVVELDKKTVASIIGVPAFLLGVGTYSKDEWNSFINNVVRPIAQEIEQEMTTKILISERMYWHFNIASLFSYDIQTTSSVYGDLYTKGLATGNEVRNKLGLEPMEGLDELILLENYIPLDKIADQKKLTQEG